MNQPDPVKPTREEIVRVLSRSEKIWSPFIPITQQRHALPTSCFNPFSILHRTPAMPEDSSARCLKKVADDEDGELVVYGRPKWDITGPNGCELSGCSRYTESARLIIGVKKIKSIKFCAAHGVSPRGRRGVIAAITMAVTYILSKKLVELQGTGGENLRTGSVWYMENKATVQRPNAVPPTAPTCIVSVGEADDFACRWWQALLAKEQGWMAAVASDSEGEAFQAPFAISIKDEFIIRRSSRRVPPPNIRDAYTPPSSSQAINYLRDFCEYHHATTEFVAAMSIAFTFPVIDWDIDIDWAILETTHPNSQDITNLSDQFSSFETNLPRYLTMCCNKRSIVSALCSGFWDPDISSNLVHAWIWPPLWDFNIKNGPLNEAHLFREAIVRGCISRRPNLAPLYLGSALTKLFGLAVYYVEAGLSMVDLSTAAWLGHEQSFIQNTGQQRGPRSSGSMPRVEVWRLLFLTSSTSLDPGNSPWKPPGEIALQSVPQEIRMHQVCRDHSLRYWAWVWEFAGNQFLQDDGFYPDVATTSSESDYHGTALTSSYHLFSNNAARNATRGAFQWVAEIDGKDSPLIEDKIYDHEWVDADGDVFKNVLAEGGPGSIS